MRTFITVLASCLFVIGFSVAVSAHLGSPYFAQQVDPSAITLDGKANDAPWNPPSWDPNNTITTDLLGGASAGEMPSGDDFDIALQVGWSAPPDNMLYVYAKVKDDFLNDEAARNGDAWRDDSMEIVTDADHGGGVFNEVAPAGSIGQQFRWRIANVDMPPGPGDDNSYNRFAHCIADPTRMWISGPPWMEAEVEKPVGRENVTYAWEGKLALWDYAAESEATSQRHINAEGQIIGLTITWNDADADVDTRDGQPGTVGPAGGEYWHNADQSTDFVLVGGGGTTAVEATSWGAIKATFQR